LARGVEWAFAAIYWRLLSLLELMRFIVICPDYLSFFSWGGDLRKSFFSRRILGLISRFPVNVIIVVLRGVWRVREAQEFDMWPVDGSSQCYRPLPVRWNAAPSRIEWIDYWILNGNWNTTSENAHFSFYDWFDLSAVLLRLATCWKPSNLLLSNLTLMRDSEFLLYWHSAASFELSTSGFSKHLGLERANANRIQPWIIVWCNGVLKVNESFQTTWNSGNPKIIPWIGSKIESRIGPSAPTDVSVSKNSIAALVWLSQLKLIQSIQIRLLLRKMKEEKPSKSLVETERCWQQHIQTCVGGCYWMCLIQQHIPTFNIDFADEIYQTSEPIKSEFGTRPKNRILGTFTSWNSCLVEVLLCFRRGRHQLNATKWIKHLQSGSSVNNLPADDRRIGRNPYRLMTEYDARCCLFI